MTTINDVFSKKTVNEVLENYVLVHNLECGYYYGLVKNEDVEKLFENYNINEDYPEAFNVEDIIHHEIVVNTDEPIMDYKKLERIMNNLGISKKEEEN